MGDPIDPGGEPPRRVLERCLRVLERYISEEPAQWFAFHRIWPEELGEGAQRA